MNTKFQKLARKIAKRDKAVFDTLLEFEKTKKIRTKTRLNFTIDKNIAQKFKKFCRNSSYNMSAKVENSIRKLMEK